MVWSAPGWVGRCRSRNLQYERITPSSTRWSGFSSPFPNLDHWTPREIRRSQGHIHAVDFANVSVYKHNKVETLHVQFTWLLMSLGDHRSSYMPDELPSWRVALRRAAMPRYLGNLAVQNILRSK